MKLLLTDTIPPVSKEGYEPVTTFTDFLVHLKNHRSDLVEVRVQSMLFGLACIYWLADNDQELLSRLNFVLDLKKEAECNVLKSLITRHSIKGGKSCPQQQPG